jgi:uncharacterized membrane protein
MQSTAHVGGHPIHPMLIPYPFALLTSGVAFDVAANVTGRHEWSRTAQHITTAGLGTAVVAALPGLVDYLGSVPKHSPTHRRALTHGLCNISAVACFTMANLQRERNGTLRPAGMAFSLLGAGLMSVAGYLGGELVYRDRVGVPGVDEPARTTPLAPVQQFPAREARPQHDDGAL